MALILLGKSQCSICHELLKEGQAIVATSHFIADNADPLWRFSDSGMHAECFEPWEHRNEFGSRYSAALGRSLSASVPAVRPDPTASKPPNSDLLVVGTPEARNEFFNALYRPSGAS